jgi:hypothetical protein
MRREEREAAAVAWIRPYRHVQRLLRTREWVGTLCPDPPEGLVLAALTHDIEGCFPGGPEYDPARQAPDDFEYRWEHSMRSAQFVHEWLYRHEAPDALVNETETLILLHEFGGDEVADVLQAADSLSFLEMGRDVVAGWVRDGRCSADRGKDQHRWMYERIRLPGARELAAPVYELALETVGRNAA